MARTIKVVTSSLATLEDTAPPYNLRPPDPRDNLRRGLELLDAAGRQGADLACLPEGFMAAGLPGDRLRGLAEPIPGPAFNAVAACARQYRMYVVAGFYAQRDGRMQNVAALIDRDGALVGVYAKKHPTEGEIESGVTPGGAVPVFTTDFGRLGLGICFDINWQPFWAELAAQGADLVCWISAYEGGFPLQAYACLHQFPIVTSVWPYHARIIDKTGRVLAASSRWGRLAICDLALDKALFHTDGQADRILPIQARYGARVRLETFTEEHLFTLESLDPSLTVADIVAEFALTEYRSYLARCTDAQVAARVPAPAAAGQPA
jgi:beta-ureidopropionase